MVREYNASHEMPAITDRHKFWTFLELAEKHAAKAAQTATSEPEAIGTGEGVKIVCNAAIDRLQIIFDAKPDAGMIGKLKGEAWKWSPSNQAWQRKLTEAAKQSAKRITGINQQTQTA